MSEEQRQKLALAWLKRNDPEYDWAALSPPGTDFVEAVRDNVNTFGPDASRASRFFL